MTAGKYSGHEYKMMQVICGNDAKKGYTLRYPLQDNSNDTGKERESRYQIVKKYKAKTVKLTVTLGCVVVLSAAIRKPDDGGR